MSIKRSLVFSSSHPSQVLFLILYPCFLDFLCYSSYHHHNRQWYQIESEPPQFHHSHPMCLMIFHLESQIKRFYQHFDEKHLIHAHYVDESIQEKFEFFTVCVQDDLNIFIQDKPEEIFLKLVEMFYSNLIYEEGVIKTKVCMNEILLSLEKMLLSLVYLAPVISTLPSFSN